MPVRKPSLTPEQARARMGYTNGGRASSGHTSGGSIDGAISAWETRRAAKFRDDPERLAETREEARQLKAYMRERGWTAEEAQVALAKLAEREAFPRSEENKVKLRPQTFEQLRIKHGSEEACRALLANAVKGQTDFAAACPTVAHRAGAIGASEEPDVIEIFSRHPEPLAKEKAP